MKISIAKTDVYWGYISSFFSLGINICLLPIVLKFLNENELGLWYVFQSIGSMVILLDFGLTPTLARNIAYSWSGAVSLRKEGTGMASDKNTDEILLKRVIYCSKYIYFIIAFIAVMLALTAGTLYVYFISAPAFEQNYVYAWLIYCFAIFINMYYGYYNACMRGIGALSQLYRANIFSKSFQIILAVILLYLDFGIMGISIAFAGSGFLFRMISKVYVNRINTLKSIFSNNSRVLFFEIKEIFITVWHNAWRDGATSLANYSTTQAMTLVCSMFLPLAQISTYSLALQILQIISTVSVTLNSVYQPSMQECFLHQKIEKNRELFSTVIISYYILFWLGVGGVLLVGFPVLRYVKPGLVVEKSYFLLLGLYIFLNQRQQLCASFISNMNKVPYMKAYVISGGACIVLAGLSLGFTGFGIWGVAFSQILILAGYNMWKWPHEALKILDISRKELFVIGRHQIYKYIKRFLPCGGG